jgi:hypothetical protein
MVDTTPPHLAFTDSLKYEPCAYTDRPGAEGNMTSDDAIDNQKQTAGKQKRGRPHEAPHRWFLLASISLRA